ncbi:protein kinase domain-containing protein [Gilvimarinus sp. 1_MG-2023]|uniref:protein kinase domain-containing protein n=1 Tax=Gilvimarinus sp. 1_MG-2023 TaxID=3062638 RepID=UPI0026E247DF|nr:protein kinase [Gilvimarinus sp. 1_MG-2023]MDO6747102.1 protein kinase [Gilvimarinus sp. 1_MG-2023]
MEIPGYKIVDTLGEGGMATVYLAIQESFEREVALKVMSPQLSKDPSFGERFIREARIVSRLMHPNIVTVYDVGVHNGNHYLSMEYVPGEDLKASRYHLELERSLAIIKDVAKALDYAGRKGYIHRDVKPENIMIHAEDGRAVLMDFGIARASDVASGMTQTGTTMGTPHYMSPEQAKGAQVDPRSDLYALGVVLFQLVCGFVPFDADSAVAVGIMHVSDPVPTLPEHLAVFQPIISKCLAKKPDQRYQNGAELIADLNAIAPEDIEHIKAQMALTPKVDDSDESAATVVSAAIANTQVNTEEVASATRDDEELPTGELFSVGSDDGIGYRAHEDNRESPATGKFWLGGAVLAAVLGGGWFAWQSVGGPSGSPSDTSLAQSSVAAISTSGEKVEAPADVEAMISDGLESTLYEQSAQVASAQAVHIDQAPVQSEDDGDVQPLATDDALQTAAQLRETLEANPKAAIELAALYRQLSLSDDTAQAEAGKQGLAELSQTLQQRFEQAVESQDIAAAESLAAISAEAFEQAEQDGRNREAISQLRQTTRVSSLLAQAEKYLLADALSSPAGANALETYQTVLSQEPGNMQAQQGLQQVAERYHVLAEAKQREGDLDGAARLIARGLKINPKHDNLLALQAAVAEQQTALDNRQESIAALNAEAQQLLARNQLITPRGNNAYETYQRLLQQAPEAVDTVNEGMLRVEQALISRIDRLLANESLDEALLQLDIARDRFPQSEGLLTQRLQLDQLVEAQLPSISNVLVAAQPMADLSQPQGDPLALDRIIHIGFEFANFNGEANVVQVVLTDGSRSVQIAQKPVIVSGTQGVQFFAIERPVTGFGKGAYHVDLKLGDAPLASVSFKVAE